MLLRTRKHWPKIQDAFSAAEAQIEEHGWLDKTDPYTDRLPATHFPTSTITGLPTPARRRPGPRGRVQPHRVEYLRHAGKI